MKELEKTKFCRMYRMPKVLPNNAFRKTGYFHMKAYFDIRFRVRQFPFNPGYLTSVSALKSRDIKIFPFKTFRLIKGPFKAGFTVLCDDY
jgi:hypothetical protein